jgi:predicted enzyme related to lactoylglutathione lyase
MRIRGIRSVMAFVADPAAAARIWRQALGAPANDDPQLVELGELELFFHLADERNPQGGTVVYFDVDDFDAARDELIAAGCAPHRGPLGIPGGRGICQLRDPFGTIWGLDGLDADL